MSEAYKKLINTLQSLFEMDKADLDFGIYRILNQKRDEISRFLENDLLAQVKDAFADYAAGGKTEAEAELDELIRTLTDAGMDPEQSPKVKELREKTASRVDITAVENEVFSHLHTFFSRYYDKGDFISQRRYKKDTYAIPYEGEEVKLYWANHDQYYIKSSEHLRDYAFVVKDGEQEKTVRFKLLAADTEKDNTKAESGKERRFVLDADHPLSVENGELHIHFHYKPAGKKKQTKLNEEAVETLFRQEGFDEWLALLEAPAPTEKNPRRTLLEKHLNDYTARNAFDYFIHKDLGSFLRRELDFYIKNEVLHLDDIDDAAFEVTETHLRKIKVLRAIAHKLIRMLGSLEDFQKKLWLKKKFVVETNYCMTLDRVPEALHGEIVANTAQHEEWVKLGFTTEDTEITEDFLRDNPFLVLDTKFFDDAFKDKLLASIENLDERCDGLLIHSENFQALSLMQERYREQVNCIYIDPPYNSPSSEIAYKNSYKHSSWLSLMQDRLLSAQKFQDKKCSCIVAIDENEVNGLQRLMYDVFPGWDVALISIEHNKKGIQGGHFSYSNEFAIFAIPYELKKLNRTLLPESEWKYSNLRNWGGESLRTDGRNCFYPIFVKDNEIVGFGDISDDDFHPQSANVPQPDGTIAVYPIDAQGIERKWRYARNTVEGVRKLLKAVRARTGDLQIMKAKPDAQFKTMWYNCKYNAGDYGTKILTNLGFDKGLFDFPKSIHTVRDCIFAVSGQGALVLDFFAGSGTTGHAVINLNREDGGSRKYILVEMGEYFDTVLKPRIQKVVYSKEWKDGKPKPDKEGNLNGISHCFKYLRLESYEDTLNNLILRPRTQQQEDILEANPSLREDYMLGYWLDMETADSPSLLNIEQFEDPFNYKLNIATGSVGATKPTRVDLIETFNYLIGLTVDRIFSDEVTFDIVEDDDGGKRAVHTRSKRSPGKFSRYFKVVEGNLRNGDSVICVWRRLSEDRTVDNLILESFLQHRYRENPREMNVDHIYVNGDHTLEDPHSKVKMIEIEFKRLMFDVRDV